MRKIRVTRVSEQYRVANNVIKTLAAVSAAMGFYLKFLPGVAKTWKPLTDHRIFEVQSITGIENAQPVTRHVC